MAIQYAIQQAILYVGDTINIHKILHSRILRSTHLEHAIDGSLAGSHGAEYCARIKSAYCTVEMPTVLSKPVYDQYPCCQCIAQAAHTHLTKVLADKALMRAGSLTRALTLDQHRH